MRLLRWLWCRVVHSWDYQNPRWSADYRDILYTCPYCHCERRSPVHR